MQVKHYLDIIVEDLDIKIKIIKKIHYDFIYLFLP